MKKIIIAVLILIGTINEVSSQTQNQTASFLEATISAYPPLSNYKIDMNFQNPDKMEETKFFLYQKHVSYDSGGWAYTIRYIIQINDIKDILVTKEKQKENIFYTVRLGLKETTSSKVISEGKLSGEGDAKKTTQLKIFLPDNYQIAQKIKKSFIHLGKLRGFEIQDLDMF